MLLVQYSDVYDGLSLFKVPGLKILVYDNFWRLPDDFSNFNIIHYFHMACSLLLKQH
jgi:hypothetical protein